MKQTLMITLILFVVFFNGLCSASVYEKIKNDLDAIELHQKATRLDARIRAANRGSSEDQLWLGIMYFDEQKYLSSFRWLKKAADQGNALAQFCLGEMHYHGNGIEKNYKKAFEWYKKAADQGNALAQYSVGRMYSLGYGVDEDFEQAIEWKIKAAKRGHFKSQFDLGELYSYEKDYRSAFKWFKKASEQILILPSKLEIFFQGHSQYKVGEMYYRGKGVKKNREKAFEWYKKAADQGNEDAEIALIKHFDYP